MQWRPTKYWAGQDAYIIGGGPSLRGFPWRVLEDRLTIGCNDAYRLGPSVCTICIFGDIGWYNKHHKDLSDFPNPVFTNQPSLHRGNHPWIWTTDRPNRGLSTEAIAWNSNTGASAVNLALLMGARRVYLLGFDCKKSQNKTNWHDDNIGHPNESSYCRFLHGWLSVSNSLPTTFPGCEIINLGPDSDLERFPRQNWADVLCPEGDTDEVLDDCSFHPVAI